MQQITGNTTHSTHLDLFGTFFGETKVNRGWLTKETIVQFKLFNEPIQMWKKSLRGKTVPSSNLLPLINGILTTCYFSSELKLHLLVLIPLTQWMIIP